MSRHELKTWPVFFQAIRDGRKSYEIRKNDRGFQVGDKLNLREWDPDTGRYTGRSTLIEVSYMTEGGQWGLPGDVCVLGFNPFAQDPLTETPR